MPQEFYTAVTKAIKLSEKSLRELEAESGVSRSKLSSLGKGGRLYADEIPRLCGALAVGLEELYGEGLFSKFSVSSDNISLFEDKVERLANQLMNGALSRAKERLGADVDTMDVIRWFQSTDGRLAECDQLLPYFTIFEDLSTPEEPLRAISVGEKSLPRKTLQTREAAAVTEYAASLEEAARLQITNTYFRASQKRSWICEPREVEVNFRTVPEPFLLSHATTALPMKDANGRKLLISFSQFMGAQKIDRRAELALD